VINFKEMVLNHGKKKEMVTNVMEIDEAHIQIVRNRSLDMEAGANYSYVQSELVLDT